MGLVEAFFEVLERSTKGEVCTEMIIFLGPVWLAFLVGVVIGWAWKPRWAGLGIRRRSKFDCSVSNSPLPPSPSSSSSSSSSSRLPLSPVKGFGSAPCLVSIFKDQSSRSGGNWVVADDVFDKIPSSVPQLSMNKAVSSMPQLKREKSLVVTEEDFEHLNKLVDIKDGGPSWIPMMERTTPSMSYQGCYRDPKIGPPQFRSRTVYEDATSELLRDFFWDDDFRLKWDDMLLHSATIEECPTTGTMIVHWIRKFPFFCSDRDYTIGRRIWAAGKSYYCVTKGVPCPSVPRSNKPRRVDLYYSSWFIRAVESRRGNGQQTACEVILFHHEDMGIPWEITKFGVRQGMWGTVKKIEASFRAYQKERAFGALLSPQALMAQINTKISPEYLSTSFESSEDASSETETVVESNKALGRNIPKLLFIGGVFVLACSLDRGLLPKAVIFGVGRKFANFGKRLPRN